MYSHSIYIRAGIDKITDVGFRKASSSPARRTLNGRTSSGIAMHRPTLRRPAKTGDGGGSRGGSLSKARTTLQGPAGDDPWRDGLGQVLRHIGEAKPSERGIENLKDAVECELTLHPHSQFAAVPLELPCVQPAIGWQTQIDAIVSDQVLRCLWRCSLREVGLCTVHRTAHVRTD